MIPARIKLLSILKFNLIVFAIKNNIKSLLCDGNLNSY